MTDVQRRAMIHVLDCQQLILAALTGENPKVVKAAADEWMETCRALRGELEDAYGDETLPFTIPGRN